MVLVICRPEMPDGDPYQTEVTASWTDKDDIIDADLLADNFRRYYTAINGNLSAQNFDFDGVKIDETKIQFPEYFRDRQPNVGHTHSHNGYDSSFLGIGAIDRSVTERRSFGAYMFPSNARALFTFHGVVPVVTNYPVETSTSSGSRTFYVDIPYDSIRLPKLWATPAATVHRSFGCLQVLNPVIRPYVALQYVEAVKVTSDGTSAMYLKIILQFRGADFPIETTDGLFLHWMVTLMARPES